MSVAVLLECPGMTESQYADLRCLLALDKAATDGLMSHIAGPADIGWRMMGIWESPEAFEAFRDLFERAANAVGATIASPRSWAVESTATMPSPTGAGRNVPTARPVASPRWLTREILDALHDAGLRSLPSLDVPAAAAVIYRGTVVTGWNDVAAATNAAGHAEINAITNAMKHFGGSQKFKELDRSKLYLVTTLEPCPMCRGAIADEHRFRPENVVVLMLKEEWYRAEEEERCRRLRLEWRYVGRPDVQQRLFCSHPTYRKAFPERCRDVE